MSYLRLLLPALLLVLFACSEGEKTGPEKVHWDRDMCELCKMAISDAAYVAQVRGGPKRKLWTFDDIGCAVLWLNDQTWVADPETEIWIADRKSTRDKVIWLDARKAHYVRGSLTPMNYGFAAQSQPAEGAYTFEQVTGFILKNGPNHICPAVS